MKFLITTLALIFTTTTFAVESKSNPVVQDVQSVFQSVQTIETNFEQTIRSARFGEKKSSGKLTIVRPGKMIWNYKNPKGRVFAADGEIITLYDPEDKQALISQQPKGSKLPAGFSFLMGEANLEKLFNVEVMSDQKNKAGNREVILMCKPKAQDAQDFKTIELTFEWLPKPMLVVSKTKDLLDSENELRFDHMKFNNKIADSTFDVKLPKGTPVVTANSL